MSAGWDNKFQLFANSCAAAETKKPYFSQRSEARSLIHDQRCFTRRSRTRIRNHYRVGASCGRTTGQELFSGPGGVGNREVCILVSAGRVHDIPGRRLGDIPARYRGRSEGNGSSINRHGLAGRAD